MMTEEKARLRSQPKERFAGNSHLFDLNDALTQLRAEAHPAAHGGHRQITLFHRAPVTQALFAFAPHGELADHSASGLVTIHALEGSLTVKAAEAVYELATGMIAVINPQVRHSVCAGEAGAAMLLTVCVEKKTV